MAKININKTSDDVLQDLFTEAFESQVASLNDIGSYECISKRDTGKNIDMEVTVTGLAGSPTMEDFKNGKVKDAKTVKIDDARGTLTYKLMPKETYTLNINDYVVVYRLVD